MSDTLFVFEISSFLSYAFIQRAFVAGVFVGLACAVLGTFLVLRKMSLIGDGLSHVSFGAVALGLFLGLLPVAVALPTVILGSILILRLARRSRVYGDAAIGIVSATAIAIGTVLASVSGGFTTDLFSYLFGSILAISPTEVLLSVILSVIVLLTVALLYWDLFSATFDEEYARASGVRTELVDTVLVILAAVTVVLSIKVVGVLLISALIILPATAALQISRSFPTTLVIASSFSTLAVASGIAVSFFLDLPTGATIVILLVMAFLFAYAFGRRSIAT